MHLIRKGITVAALGAIVLTVGAGNVYLWLQQKGTEVVDEIQKVKEVKIQDADQEAEYESQSYDTVLEGFAVGDEEEHDFYEDVNEILKEQEASQEDEELEQLENASQEDEEEQENSGFIFPNSDAEYLKKRQLKKLSKEEETIARNELYARHGYIFTTNTAMKEYFEAQDWYVGVTTDQEEIDAQFNDYERKNKELFIRYEQEKGWR